MKLFFFIVYVLFVGDAFMQVFHTYLIHRQTYQKKCIDWRKVDEWGLATEIKRIVTEVTWLLVVS